jgi:arylformamidase
MPKRIIDIGVTLEFTTPVYPEYRPFQIEILETTEDPPIKGRRSLNSSRIEMGMHCGTHMDAPFHFISEGRTIDQVPLDQCMGPCALIRLPDYTHGGMIKVSDLERYVDRLCQLRKVVLETGWNRNWGNDDYFSKHPLISVETARFLVGCGVHLVGADIPSVDTAPFEAHVELLSHDVVILENLTNLEEVKSDVFELIALPLKLKAREASPVRAIAMELD